MRIPRLFALSLIVLTAACACAEEIDNPQFGYWKKFADGSSATHEMNVDGPNGQKFKTEVATKLVSKADDAVTIERSATMEIGGQKRTSPPKSEQIKAKSDKEKYLVKMDAGAEKIEAAGKTFDCKIIEVTNPENKDMSLKLWVNDTVPGGIVKMEGKGAQGSFTSVLKSFETK